jgi:proteasome beta subunit
VTVIVAVRCADGVVLATDSQGTAQLPGNLPVKSHALKVWKLGKHFVYAGTGGQGAGQRVHANLTALAPKLNVGKPAADAATLIRSTVNPIQQQVLKEWVQLPSTQPESWGGIFCGWSKEGPWIFEIDPSGPSQFHDPIASTGSGHALAHTALVSVAHFDVGKQPLEGVKAIAYRAIESTCASSAYGVGMPVQMAVVTKDGVELLDDGMEKHTELKDFVDLWKSKEVESLGALAPQAAPVINGAGSSAERETEPGIDEAEIDAAHGTQ